MNEDSSQRVYEGMIAEAERTIESMDGWNSEQSKDETNRQISERTNEWMDG